MKFFSPMMRHAILICTCLGTTLAAFGADRKPEFVDPTIRLAPNATRDIALVKIKVGGLTKAELGSAKEPQLVDTTQPPPPGTVTFSFAKSEDADSGARIWFFTAAIDQLPAGQMQKREARVQFESIDEKVTYTLSNQATAASNWTILPPPDPWVISSWLPDVHCAALSIVPGDSPASDLRLKQSGLIEQSTKKPLGLDYLELCSDAAGRTCGTFDLAPHSNAAPLYLCVTGGFHGHGNYHGAVSLSAFEKPETQSVTLNIYSSSFGAKFAGAVLILIGVLLAWVTKVYASNRVTRDQELLPMTMLRRRVEGLQSEVASLDAPYRQAIAGIATDIDRLLTNVLTPATLDANHFIHPPSPTPFNTITTDSYGYKAFLSDQDAKINLLTVLLHEGVKPAIQLAARGATIDHILTALSKIDLIRGQSPLPSEVQARAAITQQILPELAHSIAPAGAGLAAGPAIRPELAAPVSFDRLMVEITDINFLVWGVSTLITSIVGLAVLILSNPGFGVPLDYVYCIFWGFGIPTVLQQLNAGTVMNAVGVSVPK